MKGKWTLLGSILAVLLLALAAGLSQAQGPEPPGEGVQPEGEVGVEAAVDAQIPIQGRLTDASGNPLNGNYSITARIYNVSSDGTALCSDTDTVPVSNGLFNMYISHCTSTILNGQQLWLGIKVGTDAEMTERQPIYPVPYAFSLIPGALISDTMSGTPLNVYNHGTGWGLDVYSAGHDAVHGRTGSSDHAGVAGVSWGSGIGVYGESATGVAIRAAGTGVIQSTAKSYLWISGNALQKANSADTTVFIYDLYGGYRVQGGSDWIHNKTVLVPVTIPGQLYGQNITVTGLDLYYNTSDDLTGITVSAMRRQNGVGAGDLIFRDETDYVCPVPGQCVKHWDLTQNNVLSDQRGILYIALQLSFASDTAYVNIGGVRLTLEHD
jgi:hypothetical protein